MARYSWAATSSDTVDGSERPAKKLSTLLYPLRVFKGFYWSGAVPGFSPTLHVRFLRCFFEPKAPPQILHREGPYALAGRLASTTDATTATAVTHNNARFRIMVPSFSPVSPETSPPGLTKPKVYRLRPKKQTFRNLSVTKSQGPLDIVGQQYLTTSQGLLNAADQQHLGYAPDFRKRGFSETEQPEEALLIASLSALPTLGSGHSEQPNPQRFP